MTEVTPESKNERWRLGARVAVFWGAYLGILALASNVKAVVPQQCGSLAWALTSSAAILPLTLLFLRREHGKVHEVGLDLNRTSFLRLLSGVFIGVAVFGGLRLWSCVAATSSNGRAEAARVNLRRQVCPRHCARSDSQII